MTDEAIIHYLLDCWKREEQQRGPSRALPVASPSFRMDPLVPPPGELQGPQSPASSSAPSPKNQPLSSAYLELSHLKHMRFPGAVEHFYYSLLRGVRQMLADLPTVTLVTHCCFRSFFEIAIYTC